MAPRYLLSLDPGIRACGCAAFEGGDLVDAALIENPLRAGQGAPEAAAMAGAVFSEFHSRVRAVDEVVVEWPRVYASRIRAGLSPGDPNDLLALAGVGAALAALFSPAAARSFAPSDWKGQLPKPGRGEEYVVAARVRSRLSPRELAAAEAGARAAGARGHNVWDAVGLGLHALGRFDRRRVIP